MRYKDVHKMMWHDVIKYSEKSRIANLPYELRGPAQNKYGGHNNERLRAFRGSTFGPAGEARKVSEDEKKRIEASLRKRGLL